MHQRPAAPSPWLMLLLCSSCASAEFVQVCGRHFQYQGEPFAFVGYNLRGITHYGEGLPNLQFTTPNDRATNLAGARQQGARVIRAFVAGKNATPQQVGDRLELTLNMCQTNNLFMIVCLTDFYIDSNMWPMGDEHYYAQLDGGGHQVLQHAWYAGGFEDNYWPMVEYLVTRFRDHPAIFCWEIGNELKLLSDPPLFVAFMNEIRGRIRALDPNHMITTGMISTRHTGIAETSTLARALYERFDFITSHCYNGSDLERQDTLAADLDKPLVLEEVGFDNRVFTTASQRVAALEADMDKWFQRGAAGYMQWGFQAQPNNIGDGDRYVGMDQYQNGDAWSGFVGAFQARAALLSNTPPPACPTPTPREAPMLMQLR